MTLDLEARDAQGKGGLAGIIEMGCMVAGHLCFCYEWNTEYGGNWIRQDITEVPHVWITIDLEQMTQASGPSHSDYRSSQSYSPQTGLILE